MERQEILNSKHFELTINRLCYQLIEAHGDFSNSVLIGLQPRGVNVVTRLKQNLEAIIGKEVKCGNLDITFYRDDIRRELHLATQTDLPFSIEGKTVILIDDVLFTGRTIRAALDALLAFGRPSKVSLCVLVDRKPSRELPIQPDFTGKEMIDQSPYKVKVRWQENDGVDDVILLVD